MFECVMKLQLWGLFGFGCLLLVNWPRVNSRWDFIVAAGFVACGFFAI